MSVGCHAHSAVDSGAACRYGCFSEFEWSGTRRRPFGEVGLTDALASIDVFSACPSSSTVDGHAYIQRVRDVARWSEQYGCKGILVYTDNSLIDAWLVSQIVIQHTTRLCPLVAVQPVYMHPYTVAKMVTSLGDLYGRRMYLNMVAGGFKNDLTALNDITPHDKRYDRLREYTLIIKGLLAGGLVLARV